MENRKSRSLIVALAMATCCTPSIAWSARAAAQDIETLQRAEHFMRGLVGFAGHASVADSTFERLLTTSNAQATFIHIALSPYSTAAAKAYATCGLKKLHSPQLPALVKELRDDTRAISTTQGDMQRSEPLSHLVKEITSVGC